MAKLVLFDIDGTLIYSAGAGVRAMTRALEEITGVAEGFKGIDCSGKTDPQIICEALEKLELPSHDGLVATLLDLYLACLKVEVSKGKGHVKPGVQLLLQTLRDTEGIHLGLLTGNIERGARIKLESFGLNLYFPVGAFGNDDRDRNRLLPVAVERLRSTAGVTLTRRDCIVVGDTPRDVACAHAHGAPCIAVATGPYSTEALEVTGADLVVLDLSDTRRIVKWIMAT